MIIVVIVLTIVGAKMIDTLRKYLDANEIAHDTIRVGTKDILKFKGKAVVASIDRNGILNRQVLPDSELKQEIYELRILEIIESGEYFYG